MTQIRTQTKAPSNADRMLDIEVALEVLDLSHLDTLAYYATYPDCAAVHARMWDSATDRAVAVLARPGDPSDELEAWFALTCHSKS